MWRIKNHDRTPFDRRKSRASYADRPTRSPVPDDPDGTPSYWRTQEMLLLQHVMAQVGKGLVLDEQLREILHLLSETLGLNRGRIVLRDPETGEYRIFHSYGLVG